MSSLMLGLPGMLAGAGTIYLAVGQVKASIWLSLFVLVLVIELPLHFLLAHFWNRRAAILAQAGPAY